IRRNKATSMLVILQVALTLMIVSNAVFATLTSLALWNQPTGLAEKQLVSVRHQVFDPIVDVGAMIDKDIERLNKIEGVTATLLTSEIPLDSQGSNVHTIYLDNKEDSEEHQIERFDSSEALLGMIESTVVEGRNFEPSEVVRGEFGQVSSSVAVVMISEAFAKAKFPDESAIGKTLWQSLGADPVKVIGVYSDWLAGEALDNYHTMIRPLVIWRTDAELNYLLKLNVDWTPPLLDEITDILYQTPGRYVSVVEALARPKKRMYDGRGSHSFTLLGISAMAMLITGLGISGLITFTVNQRRKQIGIRRALGGTKRQIINFFIIEMSLLTAMGVILGVVLMVVLNYVMSDQTGSQSGIMWQPLVLLIIAIWVINLIASWLPAKRASLIEPAIVTRE
ncbi:MAG: FtsX-like permease family protein, partial [Algicola sp.]|nr:FtsX-like permease family protein [Algicola sp.]